ncbi:MAG: hypothetical protein ABI743_14020 [bacterium]
MTPQSILMTDLPLGAADIVGQGPLLEATLIVAGPSHNGTFYPASTLAAAASRFAGVKCFRDHGAIADGGAPARSMCDLVGRVEEAWFAEDRIRGRIRLSQTQEWLGTLLAEGLAGDLSISARGVTRLQSIEGRLMRVVETIEEPLSVDFVTEAAAGGRVERLLSESRIWDAALMEIQQAWETARLSRDQGDTWAVLSGRVT